MSTHWPNANCVVCVALCVLRRANTNDIGAIFMELGSATSRMIPQTRVPNRNLCEFSWIILGLAEATSYRLVDLEYNVENNT